MTTMTLEEKRNEFRKLQREGMKLMGTKSYYQFHDRCLMWAKYNTTYTYTNFLTPDDWLKAARDAVEELQEREFLLTEAERYYGEENWGEENWGDDFGLFHE